MSEYSFYRRTITPLQMLNVIIKSWFTAPPRSLGCIFFLLFIPTYFLALLLQILLFLPVLPVIALIYLPTSLYLYKKPEQTWLLWLSIYTGCSALLSAPIFFFLSLNGAVFFTAAFVILSGMCGMFTYFNLYNSRNIEKTEALWKAYQTEKSAE